MGPRTAGRCHGSYAFAETARKAKGTVLIFNRRFTLAIVLLCDEKGKHHKSWQVVKIETRDNTGPFKLLFHSNQTPSAAMCQNQAHMGLTVQLAQIRIIVECLLFRFVGC